jgi:hypothetical protein
LNEILRALIYIIVGVDAQLAFMFIGYLMGKYDLRSKCELGTENYNQLMYTWVLFWPIKLSFRAVKYIFNRTNHTVDNFVDRLESREEE